MILGKKERLKARSGLGSGKIGSLATTDQIKIFGQQLNVTINKDTPL